MENYTFVLIILLLMIVAAALADRVKIPVPIFLIVIGLAIGFVPSMPPMEINPEIILLIFLPPLLYDAAFNISFTEFKVHFVTISNLAFGLVFLTAAGIAVTAHYLIPGMTWPLSFALGGILAATDAVAAIGITKGLKLPHNAVAILEGESLLNDASSLVTYRFAVAAVTGVAFVWWKGIFQFFLVIAGGFVAGVVMGWLVVALLRFFRTNELAVISLMLLSPFVTYLVAEHFQVSGVIAVVLLGLFLSRLSREKFPEKLMTQSRNFWEVIVFLLNGLIFILIGLQFPVVLKKIDSANVWIYLCYAVVITVVTFVIRLVRVYWHQRRLPKEMEKNRRITTDSLFDAKTSLIITWSGMRGIVSLAVAIAIPATLSNGEPFPMRNEIIFISIAVVLMPLLGQGLSLPWIVRKLGMEKKSE